jgi:type I restriction enzyme S subunit
VKVDSIRLPYLRVANVQDGFLDLSEIKEVVIERSQIPRYSLRFGDVLMTEGGDFDKLGRGFIWHDEIPNCLHQNHIFVVRPNGSLLSHFLASLTSSDYGRSYFQSCSKQSTNLASINSSQLKAFPVPLPPKAEQQAIVAVLSTWDLGIRQFSDLIAAKLRLKQGLMQQLLTGKRRFPGFTGKWQPERIGSFLSESRIPGTHGAEAKKLTVKLYGKGVIPKSEARAGSEATKYYRRKMGQFIYSKLDFLNGAFGIVPDELDGYESTLDLPTFDMGESVDPDWFLYFVVRESFYKNLLGLANGGRKARRVNPDDLLNVVIPYPTKDEQRHIADMLKAVDREIDLLRQQLAALKQQKKGLMQKLLTGQVRVKPSNGGD